MVAKIALIISVIALLLALGSFFADTGPSVTVPITPQMPAPTMQAPPAAQNVINSTIVSIFMPAVDNQGNGVTTKLTVQTIPGHGRLLTNINNLLFWVDTQQSIQTAEAVAETTTKIDISQLDLIYTIETNATIVEGPSAGAAITIATIAALENRPVNTSVMITGTIDPDGTIGPVGGIVAKAKAAKEIGATMLLVPEGQGIQTTYTPEQTCEQMGSFTFCTTEYVKRTVDTRKTIGIEVREISNVEEALKYILV